MYIICSPLETSPTGTQYVNVILREHNILTRKCHTNLAQGRAKVTDFEDGSKVKVEVKDTSGTVLGFVELTGELRPASVSSATANGTPTVNGTSSHNNGTEENNGSNPSNNGEQNNIAATTAASSSIDAIDSNSTQQELPLPPGYDFVLIY